jgi:hypothetical protein
MVVDDGGSLVLAKIYENGGSHYPYLSSGKSDKTFVLSGFSNYFTSPFNVMLMRLDSDYSAGCNTTDVTNHTVTEYLRAKVKTPSCTLGSGGSLANATTEADFTFGDSSLCFNSSDSCFVFTAMNDLVNENATLFIFPNPASDQLAVRISSQSNQTVTLQLFNSLGRSIRKEMINVHDGVNYFCFSTAAIPEGNYLMIISDNEHSAMPTGLVTAQKLIIQH